MFLKTLLGFEKKRDSEDQWWRGSFAGLGCMDRGMENRGDMVPFYMDKWPDVVTPRNACE